MALKPIEIQDKSDPFDIEWLAINFGLNSKDIKSAKFDIIGSYEIYFYNLKAAKQFYNFLNNAQCNPQILECLNLVRLNKYSKDKILMAAKDFGEVSKLESKEIEDEDNPFNIEWLSTNFGLKLKDIKSAALDIIGSYDINFYNLEEAKQFYNTLKKAQCNPQIFESLNLVKLNIHTKDKILRTAKIIDINNDKEKQASDHIIDKSAKKEKAGSFSTHFFLKEKKTSKIDLLMGRKEDLLKYLNLANHYREIDDTKFIKNLMYAFIIIKSSAQTINAQEDKIREYSYLVGRPHRGLLADLSSDNEKIGIFIWCIRDMQAVPKLHDLFLKIDNWEEFYTSFPTLEKNDIDRFTYFIDRIKDKIDDVSELNHYIVMDAYESVHRENPYRLASKFMSYYSIESSW